MKSANIVVPTKPKKPITLADLGENQLIKELTRNWPHQTTEVPIGVGDDCAVLPGKSPEHWLLLKTDAIVENVHFLPTAPPNRIGHKALARVVSDFAAMGGTPLAALVTLGLPRNESVSRLKKIYAGLEKTAKEFGVQLVGGETTRTEQLFLNIAALGEFRGTFPILRSTAKPGDLIYVTGKLGMTQKQHHLTFSPRLAEGVWLAEQGMATAMMDLSDGVGADLPRLCTASGVGFTLDANTVPRRKGATLEQALNDGEDFELLFTVAPSAQKLLSHLWPFKTALSCIGLITPKSAISTTSKDKQNSVPSIHGFDHFRQR